MTEHKRNCPNCAAPYDIHEEKCPYCGTYYFDMSVIDMNTREPFYLKIRYGDYVITQLVIADSAEINVERDMVDCHANGIPLMAYTRSINLSTDVTFKAVANHAGLMAEICKKT